MNGTGTRTSFKGAESPDQRPYLRTNPEHFLPIPRLKLPHAAACVFFISVVCFAVTWDGDFVFDDSEAILGNKDLLPETPITKLFYNDFWGKKLNTKTSHKSYRPLTVLTYRLSHQLAGGLKPAWFHIPNILLHAAVSALLLPVFSVLIGGYTVSTVTRQFQFKTARSALLCAALFAVHPIHTESVAGVVGRADLLCALLFLLSFLLYVKACAASLHTADDDQCTLFRPETFSHRHMFLSMLLCALSILCKEQGITVIGICSAYDILLVCRVDILEVVGLRRNLSRNDDTKTKSESTPSWVASCIKRHAYLVTTAVLVLLFRWRIMGSAPPTFMVIDNPQSFVNGTIIRGINYNYLYSINAWLLVNPWWLCFDWSMGCVPVIETFTDGRVIAAVAVWIVLGALLWTCLKGPLTQDQRVLTMSLALVIVPFLPASNLFFRVGFVIAERILYLSSIGFCMLVVLGVRQICATYPKYNMMMRAGIILVLGVFALRCVQRSVQWKTEMDLFTSGARVCPGNAKVQYNIGKLHGDLGNETYAIQQYRLAIKLNPRYDQAMNNLGNILKDRGELMEAEMLLTQAVEIQAEFAAAWMNLGIVKTSLKKFAEAERCYFQALTNRRKYPNCFYNLGNMYIEMKLFDRAIEAFSNTTRLDPKHKLAWLNMAVTYDNLGKYEESLAVARQGLSQVPDDAQLYFNIANVYGKQDKHAESEKYFLKAIQLDPNVAKFYLNLGVLYHRWKKYEKSEVYYKKSIQMNPNDPSATENLKMLYRAMGKS